MKHVLPDTAVQNAGLRERDVINPLQSALLLLWLHTLLYALRSASWRSSPRPHFTPPLPCKSDLHVFLRDRHRLHIRTREGDSTLKPPYRSCTPFGHFLRFAQKCLERSCEAPRIRFSPCAAKNVRFVRSMGNAHIVSSLGQNESPLRFLSFRSSLATINFSRAERVFALQKRRVFLKGTVSEANYATLSRCASLLLT